MASTDETAVRAVLESRDAAVRAKKADAALGAYAPDLVSYDLQPPLTAELDRDGFQAWLDSWREPLVYEAKAVAVSVDGDLALCHGFLHIAGGKFDGETADMWARQTVALRRQEGGWKIFHEHTSVPFYMDGSMRAAVDLKPPVG